MTRTREPFRDVAAVLRDRIERGELAPGAQLPTSRDLAAQHDVSLATAVRAVALLREEGAISTVHGRGSFVTAPHVIERRTAEGRYLVETSGRAPNERESEEQGFVDDIDHSEAWREPASTAVADRLGIKAGATVSAVRYRWLIGGLPSQVSTQWEPADLIDETSAEQPAGATRGSLGVPARFRAIGWIATDVTEDYRARRPTGSEASHLEVPESQPVLVIQRTHWAEHHMTNERRAIETADIVTRGDRIVIKSHGTVVWTEHEGPTS